MRQFILIGVLLFFCSKVCSQEVPFPWDSKKKIIDLYSGKLPERGAFHVVSFKGAKKSKYGLTPLTVDENGKVHTFETLSFDRDPFVLSYRWNKDTKQLILLTATKQYEYKKLRIVAFDWNSRQRVFSKEFSAIHSFGVAVNTGKELLLIQKKDSTLNLIDIQPTETLDTTSVLMKHREIFNSIFDKGTQWVNQQVFVQHGSVYPSKVYEENRTLYFLSQEWEQKNFKVISMPIDTPEKQTYVGFNLPHIKKYQDTYSYLFKGKLFIFYFNINDIAIEIYDIKKGEQLHAYSLAQDFKNQINRRKIAPLMQKFKEPKHHLTAAINEGVDGQMVINFDYIDVNAYKYGKDPFFNQNHLQQLFFQQQLWLNLEMQQQQWLNNAIKNSGGPRVGAVPMTASYMKSEKEEEERVRFSVVLEADLSVSKDPNKATLNRNKEQHPRIIELATNKKIKYRSSVAAGNDCFYIYYDKKGKRFMLGRTEFPE